MRLVKELLVKEISNRFKEVEACVCLQYNNVSARSADFLRLLLKKSSMDLMLIPKRLFKIAMQASEIDISSWTKEAAWANGSVAVVFVHGDWVAALKLLTSDTSLVESIDVSPIAAIIEGITYNKEDVISLSKLPSLEESRINLMWMLDSSASNLMRMLGHHGENLMSMLNELKKES